MLVEKKLYTAGKCRVANRVQKEKGDRGRKCFTRMRVLWSGGVDGGGGLGVLLNEKGWERDGNKRKLRVAGLGKVHAPRCTDTQIFRWAHSRLYATISISIFLSLSFSLLSKSSFFCLLILHTIPAPLFTKVHHLLYAIRVLTFTILLLFFVYKN